MTTMLLQNFSTFNTLSTTKYRPIKLSSVAFENWKCYLVTLICIELAVSGHSHNLSHCLCRQTHSLWNVKVMCIDIIDLQDDWVSCDVWYIKSHCYMFGGCQCSLLKKAIILWTNISLMYARSWQPQNKHWFNIIIKQAFSPAHYQDFFLVLQHK